ncbi:tetratricopeptide repeat protein [Maricaulis sp.]|uniref:tetratricopeptide repeat protein n=1 Tax=Maricaulis sp. TaxID=1486257 RepID=UPI0025C47F39|nr:tetratricopeptide repeat protein [Maricaulis sp.]
MVDIFEEVDEELRRDKYQDLLRQWGPWVLGAAVAVILGTVAWQGFDAWQTRNRETSSDAFIAAMNDVEAGRLDAAAAALDSVVAEGTPGYAALALMQRGNLALEQGDAAAAAGFFDEVAARASDPLLRDMAEIRSVWASWDSLSYSDIDLRLNVLIGGDSPFRHLARETIAAAALRAGEIERARTQYQFLAFASDAPSGVQRRAQEALALVAQHNSLVGEADDGAASAAAPDAGADGETAGQETEETNDAGDAGDD